MVNYAFNENEVKTLWKHTKNKRYSIKSFINRGSYVKYIIFGDKQNGRKFTGKVVTKFSEGEVYHWPRLHHKCLAPLLDVIYIDERIGIYMTSYLTQNLKDCIHDKNFLNDSKCFDQKKSYIEDVLWGLDYLHTKHLCLMNLSEANVFICSEKNRAVISNFTCLVMTQNADKHKHCAPFLYRAPELTAKLPFAINDKFDPIYTDIWSVGIMIIEVFLNHMSPWGLVNYNSSRTLEIIEKIDCEMFKLANRGSSITPKDVEDFKRFARLFLDMDPKRRCTAKNAALKDFIRPAKHSLRKEKCSTKSPLQINSGDKSLCNEVDICSEHSKIYHIPIKLVKSFSECGTIKTKILLESQTFEADLTFNQTDFQRLPRTTPLNLKEVGSKVRKEICANCEPVDNAVSGVNDLNDADFADSVKEKPTRTYIFDGKKCKNIDKDSHSSATSIATIDFHNSFKAKQNKFEMWPNYDNCSVKNYHRNFSQNCGSDSLPIQPNISLKKSPYVKLTEKFASITIPPNNKIADKTPFAINSEKPILNTQFDYQHKMPAHESLSDTRIVNKSSSIIKPTQISAPADCRLKSSSKLINPVPKDFQSMATKITYAQSNPINKYEISTRATRNCHSNENYKDATKNWKKTYSLTAPLCKNKIFNIAEDVDNKIYIPNTENVCNITGENSGHAMATKPVIQRDVMNWNLDPWNSNSHIKHAPNKTDLESNSTPKKAKPSPFHKCNEQAHNITDVLEESNSFTSQAKENSEKPFIFCADLSYDAEPGQKRLNTRPLRITRHKRGCPHHYQRQIKSRGNNEKKTQKITVNKIHDLNTKQKCEVSKLLMNAENKSRVEEVSGSCSKSLKKKADSSTEIRKNSRKAKSSFCFC